MKTKIYLYILLTACISNLVTGCKKEDSLLDAKPNQTLNTITSLKDLKLLIQDEDVFNRSYPAYGEVSTDDFYLQYSDWLNAFPSEHNAYIWDKVIFLDNENGNDWAAPYQMVYYANIILQALGKISNTNDATQYNQIKGSALFFRSVAFYNLLQEFAQPYQPQTASKTGGIPIPLAPDITLKLNRSPLDSCYNQILTDIKASTTLLPDVSTTKTLPSKAAAFALLSRIYLIMGDYNNALEYASKSLAIYNVVQDFNKLNPYAFPVFPNFSPEELFHAGVAGTTSTGFRSLVDSTLYKSYDSNDLRPSIFFYNDSGNIEFNSQFDVQGNITFSLSTAEMYFNRAECEARLNDPVAALEDLNAVLTNRWKAGLYNPNSNLSGEEALRVILNERRKEFVMTTLRWSDLRRLNQDSRFATALSRNLNGTIYTLPANDARYTLPIPNSELKFNPITQNIR